MTDQVRRYLPPCQRQLSDEDIHAFCLSVWKRTRSVGLSASTAISSRSRCFARGSPSLKARGDRMSVCRGTWDGFTPFSRALAGSWSPRVRFSSTHRRFFWTGRRDFISCFWGSGKCHLSALLSWWKSLRGGYLGNRSITSRLAAGARDLQTVKVRRQISVGWPGGGASATVSPLLRWSPWRGSSFIKKKKKTTRAVFLCRRSTRLSLMQRHGAMWWCPRLKAFLELSRATDLSLRATKQTARAIGRSMAAMVPRRDICGSTSRASRTKTALSSLMPPSHLPGYLAMPLTLSPLGFGRQSATRRRLWGFFPAVLKSRERRPPGPDQDRFLWGVKHKRRVWRAEHPLVETGVWRAALHSPPQRGRTWGASSPPRKGPEACAPRTLGVCPSWKGREKFQQRIKTSSWHPQEAVVQSPSPLVFRGAAVSS